MIGCLVNVHLKFGFFVCTASYFVLEFADLSVEYFPTCTLYSLGIFITIFTTHTS